MVGRSLIESKSTVLDSNYLFKKKKKANYAKHIIILVGDGTAQRLEAELVAAEAERGRVSKRSGVSAGVVCK